MGSLPFSVGPLVNSAGEDWMLSTSASSTSLPQTTLFIWCGRR